VLRLFLLYSRQRLAYIPDLNYPAPLRTCWAGSGEPHRQETLLQPNDLSPPATLPAGSKKQLIAGILTGLLLLAAIWAVYLPLAQHGFTQYDDNNYVVLNPHVNSGLSLENVVWAFFSTHASNWHPVTWLSHMLDVQLFGLEPGGHHLVNVALHAVASLLLLALLWRLTGALWRSATVAALFALHPLHVESVAWIAERKDVLSACFCFLTLLLYAEYTRKRSPRLFWLAFASFLLGLMSKPMLVSLPRGRYNDLKPSIDVPKSLTAPFTAGQQIGTLKVTLDGKVVAQAPLVAIAAVEEAGFFKRLWDSFWMWWESE
jgi:hypothetical protein